MATLEELALLECLPPGVLEKHIFGILDKLSPEFISSNQQQLIQKIESRGNLYSFGISIDSSDSDLFELIIIKELTYERIGEIFFTLLDISNKKWHDYEIEALDFASSGNGFKFKRNHHSYNRVSKDDEKFKELTNRLKILFQKGDLFKNIHEFQTSKALNITCSTTLYIPYRDSRLEIFILRTRQDIDEVINSVSAYKSELKPSVQITTDDNILNLSLIFSDDIQKLEYEQDNQYYKNVRIEFRNTEHLPEYRFYDQ